MRKRFFGLAVAASLAISAIFVGTASAASKARLNVVHGIPGVDVNVCVNGTEAIPDFNPGEVVTGVALAAGTYDLKIVAQADDCADPAILSANDVELMAGKNYSAVAHLDEGGDPTLALFRNNVKALPKGTARLTVRHAAAAPEVDVWANGSVLLRDVPNGASATMKVPTGVYATWVSLPDKYQPVIGPDVFKLRKGMAYQVYAWGNGTAGFDFAVVAIEVGVK
ncbi:MAG TPA: DUF4397 domain-containing protein [Actinomycetota bacterium]|nr:DUF4397 domain-containing protein [Actinomycetota bacterium]